MDQIKNKIEQIKFIAKGCGKHIVAIIAIYIGVFIVDRTFFEESQLKIKKPIAATVECIGVVGAPAELERVELKLYNLQYADQASRENPDNEYLQENLRRAFDEYVEAVIVAEKFMETEEYAKYQEGLACNRKLEESRNR